MRISHLSQVLGELVGAFRPASLPQHLPRQRDDLAHLGAGLMGSSSWKMLNRPWGKPVTTETPRSIVRDYCGSKRSPFFVADHLQKRVDGQTDGIRILLAEAAGKSHCGSRGSPEIIRVRRVSHAGRPLTVLMSSLNNGLRLSSTLMRSIRRAFDLRGG